MIENDNNNEYRDRRNRKRDRYNHNHKRRQQEKYSVIDIKGRPKHYVISDDNNKIEIEREDMNEEITEIEIIIDIIEIGIYDQGHDLDLDLVSRHRSNRTYRKYFDHEVNRYDRHPVYDKNEYSQKKPRK